MKASRCKRDHDHANVKKRRPSQVRDNPGQKFSTSSRSDSFPRSQRSNWYEVRRFARAVQLHSPFSCGAYLFYSTARRWTNEFTKRAERLSYNPSWSILSQHLGDLWTYHQDCGSNWKDGKPHCGQAPAQKVLFLLLGIGCARIAAP